MLAPRPTHRFCPGILSYTEGRRLTRDSGLRAGWERSPPARPSPASSPCQPYNPGSIFGSSLLFIAPNPRAVGERRGVCFMIASFPAVTFCLQTGFARLLSPRELERALRAQLPSPGTAAACHLRWDTDPWLSPSFWCKAAPVRCPPCTSGCFWLPKAQIPPNASPPHEDPSPCLQPELLGALVSGADGWGSGNHRGEPSNGSHQQRKSDKTSELLKAATLSVLPAPADRLRPPEELSQGPQRSAHKWPPGDTAKGDRSEATPSPGLAPTTSPGPFPGHTEGTCGVHPVPAPCLQHPRAAAGTKPPWGELSPGGAAPEVSTPD